MTVYRAGMNRTDSCPAWPSRTVGVLRSQVAIDVIPDISRYATNLSAIVCLIDYGNPSIVFLAREL